MPYAPKIVLHSLAGYKLELDAMVEAFIAGGVKLVAVVGEDCARIEELIDELVVADGSDESRFLLTSSHQGQSVEEVLEFARRFSGEFTGEVQLIEF